MKPTTILGWDAAWTPTGSGAWCVVDFEPEGSGLLRMLETTPRESGASLTSLNRLLDHYNPEVVAVDLPLSLDPVRGYREADRETTRAFSKYGCPVHSPTRSRPGEWGDACMEVFASHGYSLKTELPVGARALLEVYPHTVALYILRASYRIPYKVQRAGRYYPNRVPLERKRRVAADVCRLRETLGEVVRDLPSRLSVEPGMRLPKWKGVEDQVDALLCAVAGKAALSGSFHPFGNSRAAVWNPHPDCLPPAEKA